MLPSYLYLCIPAVSRAKANHEINSHAGVLFLLCRYDERIDRVETRIAARLRDQLGTAKSANEMFRIFSRYNALFVRSHIRGAIREYQTQLIQRVKDDIESLHNKFKVSFQEYTYTCNTHFVHVCFTCTLVQFIFFGEGRVELVLLHVNVQPYTCTYTCSSYLTVIGVHELHGRVYPTYCQITILLVVDPPPSCTVGLP